VRETLAPLDQDDGVPSDAWREAQLFERLAGVQAIQVGMHNGTAAMKLVQDLESRASHGLIRGNAERTHDGLHQASFAGTELALQEHQVARLERARERPPEPRGVAQRA